MALYHASTFTGHLLQRGKQEKKTLLDDISKAFKGGSFNDVSFIMADNSIISSNKFMLACRVPYFATLFFGGFAGDLNGDPINLNCCNSSTFKQILQFVWEGEISISGMTMQSLLELLETSRFLCLDSLRETVVMFLENLNSWDKIELKDCLVAFDFASEHKFEEVSELFLDYIDGNLSRISCVAEFRALTENSIKMLIKRNNPTATEVGRFRALANWFESNVVEVDVKNEMLDLFDVNKFQRNDLVDIVRETHVFANDEDVCVELVRHLNKLEEWMAEVKEQMDNDTKGNEIESIKCQQDKIPNIRDLRVQIRLLRMTSKEYESTSVWKIPEEYEAYFIYQLDFCIWGRTNCHEYSGVRYSYTLKASEDGENWSNIATFIDVLFQPVKFEKMKYLGSQVKFKKIKIKYLGIVVTRCNDPKNRIDTDFKPYIGFVEALAEEDEKFWA